MLSINSYFDDHVKSIAFQGKTNATTVGVMDIGEFTFDTSQYEVMTVIDGELEVKLPGTQSFNTFTNGDQFEVEANSSFEVKVVRQTAYHCTYE
ncbi:pyrimidine/purine nucleoside phosphorylase [Oceanospirillaceae bacterium]|nr:pyrimidine/purine nucleoside phosphorylase [Oceanospirillaceae bacterium]MDB9958239.1 pyrimidine/purine nucleoside phosphorylase [Oceanospirillaceae bacterium]